ncbi:gamma-glutamylcyclotransferase [Myxococcus sp. AS-1-15]|uniref:gamma-glutamylcyclotransferase n=1 Tax=Myxococcus sp. AS-1-15 TaxID=2874600 RepID=UPI001CC08C3B|nr:gamma-glutamylcyclotransferase [Myxococcus sp. AS-1-15]MBZ4394928.1 gamma-glutamylcyclotransferase [Myxococcus sp. AS-1-15]BDT36526.1 gamma-glutamylcyclotransferase [Myxococcus sp. MH1]
MPAATPSPRSWFAYSVDLSPVTARERLPGLPVLPALPDGELAEALDVDVVYDVPSLAWGGKVARLVDAPGKKLPGVLRRLSPEAWDAVSRLESVIAEASTSRPVKVRTATGALLSAHAFTPPPRATPSPQGPISEAFLVTLALAAERAGLAADYVERLQAEAQIVGTLQQAKADARTVQASQGKKP